MFSAICVVSARVYKVGIFKCGACLYGSFVLMLQSNRQPLKKRKLNYQVQSQGQETNWDAGYFFQHAGKYMNMLIFGVRG